MIKVLEDFKDVIEHGKPQPNKYSVAGIDLDHISQLADYDEQANGYRYNIKKISRAAKILGYLAVDHQSEHYVDFKRVMGH